MFQLHSSRELQQVMSHLLENCRFSDGRKFLLDFSTLLYGLCTRQITVGEPSAPCFASLVPLVWQQDWSLSRLPYPSGAPFANLDGQSLTAIRDCLCFLQNDSAALAEASAALFNRLLEHMNQARLIHDFITPVALAEMMANMLSPAKGERVLDPTCGSGRLLVAAFSRNNAITMAGVDRDETILAIAFFNLYFNGCRETTLLCQDFFNLPVDDGHMSPDIILSNPPYEDNALSTMKFVSRIITALKPGGRCGILVPEGFLTHTANRTVIRMRKRLLLEQCVQGVISLPMKIYKPYTVSSSSLIIVKKEKPRAGHAVFFSRLPECVGPDAECSDEVYREDMQRIATAWEQYMAGKGCGEAARDALYWTADLEAIQAQEYILAGDGYRHAEYHAPQIPLDELRRGIKLQQQKLDELLKETL